MPGLYAITTRSPGEILTAAKYNSDHAVHRDNHVPAMIDDLSADLAAMRATADPYPGGTPSLATSLEGELQRIRHVLNKLAGTTYWYEVAGAAMPVGAVVPYAGATAPAGWLLCDGAAVSRTTYANLFAVIGTAFGPGDGATTFNVPDLRDRVPLGASATKARGSVGGSDTIDVAQLPPHSHDLGSHTHAIPNHQHAVTVIRPNTGPGGEGLSVGFADPNNPDPTQRTHTELATTVTQVDGGGGATGGPSTNTSGNTGSGQPFLPRYQALHYIIRA